MEAFGVVQCIKNRNHSWITKSKCENYLYQWFIGHFISLKCSQKFVNQKKNLKY